MSIYWKIDVMRLLVMSDLHIEFSPLSDGDLPAPEVYDVVLLAGDTHVKGRSARWASGQFGKPVVMICGNHDSYQTTLQKALRTMKAEAAPHVRVLEQETYEYEGVRFLGCTAWSDFGATGNAPLTALQANSLLNDYRYIRLEPTYRRLRPHDTQSIACSSRKWLFDELNKPFSGKTVVITHHPPLLDLIPNWDSSPHSQAIFGNDWRELLHFNIDLWIFGHTHQPIDKVFEDTRFVSNPRGYPNEEVDFDSNLIITI